MKPWERKWRVVQPGLDADKEEASTPETAVAGSRESDSEALPKAATQGEALQRREEQQERRGKSRAEVDQLMKPGNEPQEPAVIDRTRLRRPRR